MLRRAFSTTSADTTITLKLRLMNILTFPKKSVTCSVTSSGLDVCGSKRACQGIKFHWTLSYIGWRLHER